MPPAHLATSRSQLSPPGRKQGLTPITPPRDRQDATCLTTKRLPRSKPACGNPRCLLDCPGEAIRRRGFGPAQIYLCQIWVSRARFWLPFAAVDCLLDRHGRDGEHRQPGAARHAERRREPNGCHRGQAAHDVAPHEDDATADEADAGHGLGGDRLRVEDDLAAVQHVGEPIFRDEHEQRGRHAHQGICPNSGALLPNLPFEAHQSGKHEGQQQFFQLKPTLAGQTEQTQHAIVTQNGATRLQTGSVVDFAIEQQRTCVKRLSPGCVPLRSPQIGLAPEHRTRQSAPERRDGLICQRHTAVAGCDPEQGMRRKATRRQFPSKCASRASELTTRSFPNTCLRYLLDDFKY